MSIIKLVQQKQNVGAFVALLICILLSAASIITASIVQRDFGGVEARQPAQKLRRFPDGPVWRPCICLFRL